MTLYRVYGDEAGETYLATIELPVLDVHSEGVARLRGLVDIPATSVGVVELLEPTPSQDLHPAPERRLLVFLRGEDRDQDDVRRSSRPARRRLPPGR